MTEAGQRPPSGRKILGLVAREVAAARCKADPRAPSGCPRAARGGRIWSIGKSGVDDGGIEDPENTGSGRFATGN